MALPKRLRDNTMFAMEIHWVGRKKNPGQFSWVTLSLFFHSFHSAFYLNFLHWYQGVQRHHEEGYYSPPYLAISKLVMTKVYKNKIQPKDF